MGKEGVMDAIELKFSDFIMVDGASKLLGVSKGTVRKWESEGKLKSVIHPINGYRLFKEEDLRNLLWKLKIEKKQ